MSRPHTCTTLRAPDGWTLAIVEHAGQYVVGTLSSHLRVVPLAEARYATYGAAHDRLEAEWRQRVRPSP